MKSNARTEFHPAVRTSLPQVNLLCITRQIKMIVEQYPAPSLTTNVSINRKRGLQFEHTKTTHGMLHH